MADANTTTTSSEPGGDHTRRASAVPAPEASGPVPDRRRLWWVVGIVGCLAGATVAVWLALANTMGQVTWTDTAYQVVDDSTVTVAFDVHRPAGTAVTCTVRALDERFGTVGTVQVDIPAGPDPDVHREATIRTTTRAVTGTVKRCSAA